MRDRQGIIEICDRYSRGEGSWKIARNFSLYPPDVLRIVRANNGTVRPAIKYDVNHSVFSVIDSQAKAYWLGFIAADGYVGYRDALRVNLAKGDSGHLEKLRIFLETNSPVKSYAPRSNPHGFSKLSVTSKPICSDLAKFGIIGKKSSVLRWPNLEESLLRHFLRGYFDGDGCIYVSYKGAFHKSFGICLVSNPGFLTSCGIWISKACNIPPRDLLKAGNSFKAKELRYRRQSDVQSILRLMYRDSCIGLERKIKLAEALVDGPDVIDRRKIRHVA